MAPDLKVDLALLETTAGSLGMLTEEFKNADTIVDGYEEAIGSSDVVNAVRNFAANWKQHRGDMLKSMDSVYQMATQSHTAYVDADDKLAADITKATAAPVHQTIGGAQ